MVCNPQTDRAAKEEAVSVLSRVWPHQALLSVELCPGRILSCPGKNTFCSVTKLCLTLCDPMDCNMPDFSVLHYFLEFAQIHVLWVCDAI